MGDTGCVVSRTNGNCISHPTFLTFFFGGEEVKSFRKMEFSSSIEGWLNFKMMCPFLRFIQHLSSTKFTIPFGCLQFTKLFGIQLSTT